MHWNKVPFDFISSTHWTPQHILVVLGAAVVCAVVLAFFVQQPAIAPENGTALSTEPPPASPPPGTLPGGMDLAEVYGKYGHGSCLSDAECFLAGCSSQFCSSEDIVTTCEIRGDFPDKTKYRCGCVTKRCEWIRR